MAPPDARLAGRRGDVRQGWPRPLRSTRRDSAVFQALRCRRSRSGNSAFTNSGFIRGKVLFSGVVSASLPQALRTALSVVGLSVLLAACAASPHTAVRQAGAPGSTQLAQVGSDSALEDFGDAPDDNDPLEVPNRMFFAFNEAPDFMIIRTVSVTYRYIVPTGVRNTVRNFLRNLRSPVTLANDLLQGDIDRKSTRLNSSH